MKLTVRPALTLSGGDINTANLSADVSTQAGDSNVNVRLANVLSKDGANFDGVSVGISNERWTLIFDGHNNAQVKLRTHATIQDRHVGLTFRHDLRGGATNLEGTHALDDDTTVGVVYDLTNFDGLNAKAVTAKLTRRLNDDVEVGAHYNVGAEQLSLNAKYALDAENALKVVYAMDGNASLEWTNSAGVGGGGDLRITATANVNDLNGKSLPTLKVEKVFDVDN